MVWSHSTARSYVNTYLEDINTKPLRFSDYRRSKGDFSKNWTVRECVMKVMELSKWNHSETFGILETYNGCNRSSIDIWRHIAHYRPDISIFDVMSELYNIMQEDESDVEDYIETLFCPDVMRRVFYYDKSTKFIGGNRSCDDDEGEDEFGLEFCDWKDINKE